MWYYTNKGKNVFQNGGKYKLRSENTHLNYQSTLCMAQGSRFTMWRIQVKICISKVSLERADVDNVFKRK